MYNCCFVVAVLLVLLHASYFINMTSNAIRISSTVTSNSPPHYCCIRYPHDVHNYFFLVTHALTGLVLTWNRKERGGATPTGTTPSFYTSQPGISLLSLPPFLYIFFFHFRLLLLPIPFLPMTPTISTILDMTAAFFFFFCRHLSCFSLSSSLLNPASLEIYIYFFDSFVA